MITVQKQEEVSLSIAFTERLAKFFDYCPVAYNNWLQADNSRLGGWQPLVFVRLGLYSYLNMILDEMGAE